jgi:hypothetical protein
MADRTWMSFTWKLGTTHKGKNLGMIKHEAPGYLAWAIRNIQQRPERDALDKAEIYINETDPDFFERHK